MSFSALYSFRIVKQNICRDFRVLTNAVYKCTKASTMALSQVALKTRQSDSNSSDLERTELVLLKNILCIGQLPSENKKDLLVISKTTQSNYNYKNKPKTIVKHGNAACSKTNVCNKQHLLLWEQILLNPQCTNKSKWKLQNSSVKPDIWYSNEIYSKEIQQNSDFNTRDDCLQFTIENEEIQEKERLVETSPSGSSPEQLSLVLLRLREELPHFFEGRHRYSIYSENILFVNKLTRTTTRTLKAYKFLMQVMQYTGKLFWSQVSFDVVRITKHPEDNTIKLRWTAKGIPWHLLPFYFLTGRPQPLLFYRYVDGFSIFEVGRDGLVHCHRLDKVMPTSTPERQRWSLRLQILTLLGIADINRGACETFQMKNQEIVKKA